MLLVRSLERDAPELNAVVAVDVVFRGLRADLLDPPDEAVLVPVGVEEDGADSTVFISNLLPAVLLPRLVVINGGELERIPNPPVEFVLAVLIEVPRLLDDVTLEILVGRDALHQSIDLCVVTIDINLRLQVEVGQLALWRLFLVVRV